MNFYFASKLYNFNNVTFYLKKPSLVFLFKKNVIPRLHVKRILLDNRDSSECIDIFFGLRKRLSELIVTALLKLLKLFKLV